MIAATSKPKKAPRKWDYASVLDNARQFTSLKSWERGDCGAYNFALRRGVHRRIAEELGWGIRRRAHTYETLLDSARQFSSLEDWKQKDSGAYNSAHRRGIHRQIAGDLGWDVHREHTYESLLDSARQFKSLKDWERGDKSAYKAALRRGTQRQIADELSWGNGEGGFKPNKPGTLYYIRVDTTWRAPLYKIGITNFDATTRFKDERVNIIVLRETRYESGADARAEERRLHDLFAEHRYCGEDTVLLRGGDTELFEFDVMGLDRRIAA